MIDLPPPAAVEVTEHQRISRTCPACGCLQPPASVVAGEAVGQSRFGVRVTSLIVYVRTVARLPVRTIQEYLHTLHGLTISVGGIVGLLQRVHSTTTAEVDRLREQARASPVAHRDETGWREGGQNGYVWCLATPGPDAVRFYTYDPSRAGAVAHAILGDGFTGYLGTDFYGGDNGTPGGKHQRCGAHLLRDLHALREAHKADTPVAHSVRRWVRRLQALYRLARWALRRTPALTHETRTTLATRWDRRMQGLCLPSAQQKDHPCHTLAQRLLRHQGEIFAFVAVDGLAPDNNLAERSIRPFVIGRKISGGTRSAEGSATRMALTSLCATWRARGRNPFLQCRALLTAKTPAPQL